jgi:hypothetical protein
MCLPFERLLLENICAECQLQHAKYVITSDVQIKGLKLNRFLPRCLVQHWGGVKNAAGLTDKRVSGSGAASGSPRNLLNMERQIIPLRSHALQVPGVPRSKVKGSGFSVAALTGATA